ncbi:MAG: response regulator transcription factor [Actinobacteria bacterium]|nr:response regulator transcription factor [Actinomycetota bacterium]
MPTDHRVLVVEDDETLAQSIRYNLEREGFSVEVVADGSEVLREHKAFGPSLVVLDLMLPGMSGLDVLRELRVDSTVPVIIVTAKDTEADKVTGLELGADDYVTKPFSMRELLSRIRAILRRADLYTNGEEPPLLIGGRVRLDADRHEVRVDAELVPFRPKEFDLLEALLRRKGKLVTRAILLDEVWGYTFYGDMKTLDVHIKRVRDKIEQDPSHPTQIVTVRGLGYKFVDENA